ncbi:hypothetical protein [Vibrio sp. STUT-A11]|uniref:hypothetical protein n=1 Tax=unclassified Vibrio TaxID=2614977 RepID=UPI002231033D|nr:hypothetical protein [Vibrio sp. STUT-A11]
MNRAFLYDEKHPDCEDVGMLTFNRTLMMTLTCLIAMLLTSLAPNVQASTIPSDSHNSQVAIEALQAQLGVNTDCIESSDDERMLTSGQDQHTSCSASCIVKVPVTLPKNSLMRFPYRLALIGKAPSVKAISVVYQPYRPPIV